MAETLQELIGARGFERFRQGLEARFDAHRLVYKIHYGETPPNSSLLVRLESKDRIGEVCAWESGDCDVQIAEFQKDEVPRIVHHQLHAGSDFHVRLAEVFCFVAKQQQPIDK
jgi:hypothetical protein